MDNAYCTNYEQSNSFSKLFLDYVAEDADLRPFYAHSPAIQSIPNAIQQKKAFSAAQRELLVERLKVQYQHIDTTAAVHQNIELLKQENTFTITTGHQLSIFTGEWYFIFKIMTAISMAKEAKLKNPEYNFVPVFWMASEDHDFAEINHIQLGSHQFEWKFDATGPTGRLKVDSIESLITSLEHFLKGRTYASELISMLKIAYKKENSLAESTRILVDLLFKNEGLVIVDADDIELKKSWSPIIEKELFQQKSFEACTSQTNALEKLNYPSQLFPREINMFYILDGFRERIISDGDTFKTSEGSYSFTSQELKSEIDNQPERFSPNVVLRPVYQESILPNLCYIGGPGEIAYWLQLKLVFENYNIPYPILAWRNNFMITDQHDIEKWNALGFSINDFFKSILQLEKEYVVKHQTEKINLVEEELLLKNYIELMKQKAIRVDDNLKYSLLGTEKRILRMMERIEHKIWKAEKRKYKSSLNQISDLKSKYFPGGKLQERAENFSLWYANCGTEGMQVLLNNTEAFAKHIKTIAF